jgi:hypothetical protein
VAEEDAEAAPPQGLRGLHKGLGRLRQHAAPDDAKEERRSDARPGRGELPLDANVDQLPRREGLESLKQGGYQ